MPSKKILSVVLQHVFQVILQKKTDAILSDFWVIERGNSPRQFVTYATCSCRVIAKFYKKKEDFFHVLPFFALFKLLIVFL